MILGVTDEFGYIDDIKVKTYGMTIYLPDVSIKSESVQEFIDILNNDPEQKIRLRKLIYNYLMSLL